MNEPKYSKIEQIALEFNDPEQILNSVLASRGGGGRSQVSPQHKYTSQAPVPACDSIEEQLVRIWSELLGHESIGIFDNFFELGGHSLQATQVLSRVRETFEVELPLASIFEREFTIAELADQLRKLLNEDVGNSESVNPA